MTMPAICVRCGLQPPPGSVGTEDGFCLCGGALQGSSPGAASYDEIQPVHSFLHDEVIVELRRNGEAVAPRRRFRQDQITVGRETTKDIALYNYDTPGIRTTSRNHCTIMRQGREWQVRNDSDSNVLLVGSKMLDARASERLSFPVELALGRNAILSLALWREKAPSNLSDAGRSVEVQTERGWSRHHEHTGRHWIVVFTRYRPDVDPGPATLRMPAILDDRYEIVDVLSNGGFGVIYIAHDHRLSGRRVLVKARRYDQDSIHFRYRNDNDRERIVESRQEAVIFEASALALTKRLNEGRVPLLIGVARGFSPQLWGPHSSGVPDEHGQSRGDVWYWDAPLVETEPYLIVQWIEGETLETLIANEPDLCAPSWRRKILRFTFELTSLLEVLHGTGEVRSKGSAQSRREIDGYYFIYQDLKPSNILVTEGEFLTLIDFGAAIAIQKLESGAWDSCTEGAGEPGTGTAGYKPLEMDPRSNFHLLDQRVDVYTLGASMFYMLTGEDPNKIAPEYGPLPLHLLKANPPRMARMPLPLPEAIVAFLDRALAQDRNSRFATMTEMREALPALFALV